jgi:hypothetical protein
MGPADGSHKSLRGALVRRENVKHYRLMLEQTADEAERKKLHKLLAEEQQKQVEAGDPPDRNCK